MRNPTISYGSIMQCFCVGINFNYTMSLSLQVLSPLAADFDGDTLNIMHIINSPILQLQLLAQSSMSDEHRQCAHRLLAADRPS